MKAEIENIVIEKIKGGDYNACNYIVDKYKTFVFNICIRIVRNREDAETRARDANAAYQQALARYGAAMQALTKAGLRLATARRMFGGRFHCNSFARRMIQNALNAYLAALNAAAQSAASLAFAAAAHAAAEPSEPVQLRTLLDCL